MHYEVAAGLQGNAVAVDASGNPVKNQFVVKIGDKPPQTCVTGSGKIVKGNCQLTATP